GIERGEEIHARPTAVLIDAFVTGRADVAGLVAAQLPGDPIRRFDPTLRRGIDLGVFFQQLQTLGELPLRGDASAVAWQPRFAASCGERIDAIGVRLCRVVLHSFTYACGRSRNRSSRHSGVPSMNTGTIVQAVKSVAIPMTC